MHPVVFCADKKFIDTTKIAIDSLVRTASELPKIYIIVPELIEDFIDYYVPINQIAINEDELSDVYLREYDRISAFTYARLLIPKLIKEDYCLYLDGDMIFNKDIVPLLKMKVDFLGMVKDGTPEWLLSGVEKPVYYNAGLILMNLKALRKAKFTQTTLEYVKDYRKSGYYGREGTWLHDQTALNALYSEKITELDASWNTQLKWNPPTEYKDLPTGEINIHFLTDYNKPSFFRKALSNYRLFPSVCDSVDIMMVIDKFADLHRIKETYDSVVNQLFKNWKFHIFYKNKNSILDNWFKELENDQVVIYDVSEAKSLQEVYEYAKNKLTTKWVLVLDEDCYLNPNALLALKFHQLRYRNTVIFGTASLVGDYHENQFWPHPKTVRVENLFYAWIRDCCIYCKLEQFKKVNFIESFEEQYMFYEFINWLIAYNESFGATQDPIVYKRTDDFDRDRFYKNPLAFIKMIQRSFKRYGFDLNEELARTVNPYINQSPESLSPEDRHELMRIRSSFEDKREDDVFDEGLLYKFFKV